MCDMQQAAARWAKWVGATAALVAMAASGWILRQGSAPSHLRAELLAGHAERRFRILNAHAFRARPRMITVPQFRCVQHARDIQRRDVASEPDAERLSCRSLYSASLHRDPQETKQPAPTLNNRGLFRSLPPCCPAPQGMKCPSPQLDLLLLPSGLTIGRSGDTCRR